MDHSTAKHALTGLAMMAITVLPGDTHREQPGIRYQDAATCLADHDKTSRYRPRPSAAPDYLHAVNRLYYGKARAVHCQIGMYSCEITAPGVGKRTDLIKRSQQARQEGHQLMADVIKTLNNDTIVISLIALRKEDQPTSGPLYHDGRTIVIQHDNITLTVPPNNKWRVSDVQPGTKSKGEKEVAPHTFPTPTHEAYFNLALNVMIMTNYCTPQRLRGLSYAYG